MCKNLKEHCPRMIPSIQIEHHETGERRKDAEEKAGLSLGMHVQIT